MLQPLRTSRVWSMFALVRPCPLFLYCTKLEFSVRSAIVQMIPFSQTGIVKLGLIFSLIFLCYCETGAVLKQARLCNRIDNVRIAYLQLLHFCDSDSEAQLFVIEEKTQQRSSYSI